MIGLCPRSREHDASILVTASAPGSLKCQIDLDMALADVD